MKAAVYYENGPPEVFRYEDVPDPVCPPQGVIVDVESISIEGGDAMHRQSTPFASGPHVVGYQSAGRVSQVGSDVSNRRVGDRVVAVGADGSHAARFVAAAAMTWPVPEGADLRSIACVPVAFAAAHEALFALGQLEKGQRVLVHAGAGGIGLAAIQLARAAGAEVLTTASSDEKLARLKAFGASHGINSTSSDLAAAVAKAVGPNAVDLIIDTVGGKTLLQSVSCLAYRGRIVNLGLAGRDVTPFNPLALWDKNGTLIGLGLMNSFQNEYARIYAVVAECIDRVVNGELKVVIAKSFSLADAAKAHAAAESRSTFGRVVMTP